MTQSSQGRPDTPWKTLIVSKKAYSALAKADGETVDLGNHLVLDSKARTIHYIKDGKPLTVFPKSSTEGVELDYDEEPLFEEAGKVWTDAVKRAIQWAKERGWKLVVSSMASKSNTVREALVRRIHSILEEKDWHGPFRRLFDRWNDIAIGMGLKPSESDYLNYTDDAHKLDNLGPDVVKEMLDDSSDDRLLLQLHVPFSVWMGPWMDGKRTRDSVKTELKKKLMDATIDELGQEMFNSIVRHHRDFEPRAGQD